MCNFFTFKTSMQTKKNLFVGLFILSFRLTRLGQWRAASEGGQVEEPLMWRLRATGRERFEWCGVFRGGFLEVVCPAGGQDWLEEALTQNRTALTSDPCSTSSWFSAAFLNACMPQFPHL